MKYQLPQQVKSLIDKFQKHKYQIYIVGGAIRNLLMRKEVKDWDFATDAKPEEILKVLPEGFYDNKFGTVGIQSSAISSQLSDKNQKKSDDRRLTTDDSVFEITTMRKEGIYKDSRHPQEVFWTNNIEEDLARRDFTINAIALSDDRIVDPFHGENDIKNKIIKAVGNPNLRFQEDALRLIRAVRIAAELEFEIEKETKNTIVQNVTLIKNIANERIRDELFKILSSKNCYAGIVLLREVQLLQIILPELERCFGIIQQGPKHARVYDIGEHSLLALKHTPSVNPLVRLAALLHDIGKADTQKVDNLGNVTFYNHDVVGGNLINKISRRFNLSKKQADKLYKLIRFHMFTVDERQTDSAIRRFIKNVGLENIDDIMALRTGDRLGGGTLTETSWRMEKFKSRIKQVLQKPFSITDLKVNGTDVMKELNIKAGPKVGEVLQKLFEEVLEDSSKNNRDYLTQRMKKFA